RSCCSFSRSANWNFIKLKVNLPLGSFRSFNVVLPVLVIVEATVRSSGSLTSSWAFTASTRLPNSSSLRRAKDAGLKLAGAARVEATHSPAASTEKIIQRTILGFRESRRGGAVGALHMPGGVTGMPDCCPVYADAN
ncbi:unnamed protein product, partial [Rhizoctonia solani]